MNSASCLFDNSSIDTNKLLIGHIKKFSGGMRGRNVPRGENLAFHRQRQVSQQYSNSEQLSHGAEGPHKYGDKGSHSYPYS